MANFTHILLQLLELLWRNCDF